MKILVKPPKETFQDAAWVSHVKLMAKEVSELGGEGVRGIENIRYTVEHVEVLKKPAELDALPSEVFGSSLGDLMLEEGKEYLLCGGCNDGRLACIGGQVKPEEVYRLVAQWSEIPAAFVEQLKTFS